MDFKKLLPHLYALLVILAVAAFFYAPNFFSGKALPQPDNDKARAIQTEIQEYIKKDGEAPLWTNSLFGGMPTFQIFTTQHGNLTKPLTQAAFLWTDATGVWASTFAAMMFMYLLLVVLKADWRVAIFGAVVYGINTYNVDILEAGHTTKMAALALTPGMLAGLVMLFNGRLISGTAVLALLSAMQISVNHIQITYYTLLIMGIYGVFRLVQAIREKSLPTWVKAAALSVVALALGMGSNLSKVWPTYEYGQESIRGSSELKSKTSKGDGLDKDYLFGWSSGIEESLSLVVPHATGGGGGESFRDLSLYKMVMRSMPKDLTPAQLDRQVSMLMYSGEQPFVGTAIYFGIVAVFLFFIGAFLVPGNTKWWLLLSGLFMVSLAWGKHFFLNHVLYDYLPMFSKFRAVTMAFGLGQLCVAALAALGLQRLADPSVSVDTKKKALMYSAGLTAVLCLLAIVMAPSTGPNDGALGNNPDLLSALTKDRSSLLYGDVYRSLGLLAVAAGLIWLFLRGTLNALILVLGITALALGDQWMVCRRTLTDSDFETKKAATALPKPSQADLQIKADPDPYYRVLDITGGDIATNYYPSFFHKNIGGYHAAKLQRFQEVVDTFLRGENLPKSMHILGMMNVKYFITDRGPSSNPEVCGNAWFVDTLRILPDADTELHALRNFKPRSEALVQQQYIDGLEGFKIQPDSTATIKLTKYHPDRMEYTYSAKTEQLAVFSEMYYPPAKGWKCYLNGQPAPDFTKVDYLLRGMRLPAGENQVLEMRFEPKSYILGEKLSMAASALTLLLCALGLFLWYRGGARVETPVHLDTAVPEEKPAHAPVSGKKKK